MTVWGQVFKWLGMRHPRGDLELWLYAIMNKKQTREKDIKCAAIAATIYNIWYERNLVEFHQAQGNTQEVIKRVMEQVKQRIMYLDFTTHRYTQFLEQLV